MEGTSSQPPKTFRGVFKDYKLRRAGFIKALTTEMDELHKQCDPEKEELCLYVFPDGRWEVNPPFEIVPTELPEPARGINFQRDKMEATNWRNNIASYSDAWLYSVAFYFAGYFKFGKRGRKKLFEKINDLPTVLEVVSKEAPQENEQNNISGSMSPRHPDTNPKEVKNPTAKDEYKEVEEDEEQESTSDDEYEGEEEGEEQDSTPCGSCGAKYRKEEFWICCDTCDTWYHGECVEITPEEADIIEEYKCPRCLSQEG